MAAILKFQDGGPIVVRKNANIGFRKNNALKFLKMYSFANPQKIPTKLLIATTLTELICYSLQTAWFMLLSSFFALSITGIWQNNL